MPRKLQSKEKLNKAFRSCKRSAGKKGSVFVFFIDANGLKKINDTKGHIFGDIAIDNIAHVLADNVRKTDRLIRFGGDEFVVLMSRQNRDDVEITADRIHNAIKKDCTLKSIGGVGVSIGIEEYDPRKHCRINDVIHEADMLMYKAKRRKSKTVLGWKEAA